jgi:hypothetical protein
LFIVLLLSEVLRLRSHCQKARLDLPLADAGKKPLRLQPSCPTTSIKARLCGVRSSDAVVVSPSLN